ncbi:MAG TPA: glycosyltransferase family 2 protein [Acidimicrobiales bacterium]|jgi:glycosyltransferase involved in cell wall biosynthesis|nr:glycosyltransferase family 2 protein [Acidimicrobiales bacterium]
MTSGAPDAAAPTLSFVIPFWNEEAGADRCLREVREGADRALASGRVAGVEIVAVDDGCTDETPAILAAHAAADDRVRTIRHPVNRGLGGALRTGLGAVTTDWAFYTDADLPVAPDVAFEALDRALETGADLVSCRRRGRLHDGARRSVISAGYNAAVRLVVRLPLADVNAPAKLFRRSIIERSLPGSTSAFCDVEILARAIAGGAEVVQLDAASHPRLAGRSSLSSPRAILATSVDLVRYGPGLRVRRGPAGDQRAASSAGSAG